MRHRYRSGDQERTIRVEPRASGYRVVLEERSFEVVVRRSEGVRLDLLVDGRSVAAIVVCEGDRRIVKLGGEDPVTILRSESARKGVVRPGIVDGRLVAAMDGQVVTVLAHQGERVEAGTPLVVLEAMKMEIRMVAPFRALVRRISCAPGDIVERGRVLVELDPLDGEPPG